MSTDDYIHLAYLGLLGVAVVGWFISHNRASLGKTAQQAAVWGFIFLGVIAAIGLWEDIRQSVAPRQSIVNATTVEVPRARDGHYYLTLGINGTPVQFVVDTGASDVVLSPSDARRVGYDPNTLVFTGRANTANGVVRTASVTLETVRLENMLDRNLRASVNEAPMDGSLLGMAYLSRFSSIEIRQGKLILVR